MTGFRSSNTPQPPGRDPPGLPLLRLLAGSAAGDAVLRLAGEIDITTADSVTAAVDRCLRDRPARLCLDLRAVTFCDCAGARALRQARQQATAAGTAVRVAGLSPPVRRLLALLEATDLLTGAESPGRDEQDEVQPTRPVAGPGPGGVPVAHPPGPPPDAVGGARRELTEQFAGGVERLLWELDKQPMPDAEAIRRAITATSEGDAHSAGPALVLLEAARLALDRLEAEAVDAAHAAGISDETLAAHLGLPDAQAAAAWRQWLATRRALPYDDPPPARHPVPYEPADAAARAGRRAQQAAARIAQAAHRLEQLSRPEGRSRPVGREQAGHAGQARILAAEAAERATLGLLRAADALERCAAGYQQLASADDARAGEYRHEAAWYWHTAQGYRQLAAGGVPRGQPR